MNFLAMGKEVLKKEAEAILCVMETLGSDFNSAIETIGECTGRVVLLGMGKSGLICKKIASTFSSTGTPAIFLHPADSLHGDLGMLQKGDVLIIVSNSGETEEIVKMLPWVKRMGIPTVIITGDTDSTIAACGDVVLRVHVDEACPYNIVPTSSTTATLALGDAIAVALMEKRAFKIEDFASLHPGGALGRRLFLKVEDLMRIGSDIPKIYMDTPMKDALIEISSKRLGIAGVFSRSEELLGSISDGDLRRAIEKYDRGLFDKKASEIMTSNPKLIAKDALAAYALKKMEDFSITSLFVIADEKDTRPIGIIHIHDLLKAKVV
jgi:arabinose-5-phosphate isomerase